MKSRRTLKGHGTTGIVSLSTLRRHHPSDRRLKFLSSSAVESRVGSRDRRIEISLSHWRDYLSFYNSRILRFALSCKFHFIPPSKKRSYWSTNNRYWRNQVLILFKSVSTLCIFYTEFWKSYINAHANAPTIRFITPAHSISLVSNSWFTQNIWSCSATR